MSTAIEIPVKAQAAVNDLPASRRRRVLPGLLAIGATALFCLAVLELGLRPLNRYPLQQTSGYFAEGGISYVLKENAVKKVVWPTVSFTVYTCDMGYRAPKPGPRVISDKPYCAFIGSSDVFGNGLDYYDTFAGVLAKHLTTLNIDSVNLAVAGHHLLEQIDQFKRFAESVQHKPKYVAIFLNPLFIGGYDDVHPGAIVKRGEIFQENTWKKGLLKMYLANSSAAYCFFRDALRNIQLKVFQKEDFSLSFYVDRYSPEHSIRNAERTDDFLKRLTELEDYIRSIGSTPLIIYSPAVGGFLLNDMAKKGKIDAKLFDTTFFAEMPRQHADSRGVPYVDLEPMLQVLYDNGQKLNFDLDGHFNGPTSKAVGDHIFQELKDQFTK